MRGDKDYFAPIEYLVGKVAQDFHCLPSEAWAELGYKHDPLALGEVYEYIALTDIYHRHNTDKSDKAAIYKDYKDLYEAYLLSLFDDDG